MYQYIITEELLNELIEYQQFPKQINRIINIARSYPYIPHPEGGKMLDELEEAITVAVHPLRKLPTKSNKELAYTIRHNYHRYGIYDSEIDNMLRLISELRTKYGDQGWPLK